MLAALAGVLSCTWLSQPAPHLVEIFLRFRCAGERAGQERLVSSLAASRGADRKVAVDEFLKPAIKAFFAQSLAVTQLLPRFLKHFGFLGQTLLSGIRSRFGCRGLQRKD